MMKIEGQFFLLLLQQFELFVCLDYLNQLPSFRVSFHETKLEIDTVTHRWSKFPFKIDCYFRCEFYDGKQNAIAILDLQLWGLVVDYY